MGEVGIEHVILDIGVVVNVGEISRKRAMPDKHSEAARVDVEAAGRRTANQLLHDVEEKTEKRTKKVRKAKTEALVSHHDACNLIFQLMTL